MLAPDYRRIVELVAEAAGDEGVSARDLAVRLRLEAVPGKIEGVRSKAKRLARRGWLEASPTGRFTPGPPSSATRPSPQIDTGPVSLAPAHGQARTLIHFRYTDS